MSNLPLPCLIPLISVGLACGLVQISKLQHIINEPLLVNETLKLRLFMLFYWGFSIYLSPMYTLPSYLADQMLVVVLGFNRWNLNFGWTIVPKPPMTSACTLPSLKMCLSST